MKALLSLLADTLIIVLIAINPHLVGRRRAVLITFVNLHSAHVYCVILVPVIDTRANESSRGYVIGPGPKRPGDYHCVVGGRPSDGVSSSLAAR